MKIVVDKDFLEEYGLEIIEEFELECYVEGMYYMLDWYDMGIFLSGKSYQELIARLKEELSFVWKQYGCEDIFKLTLDGLHLKMKIMKLVRKKV